MGTKNPAVIANTADNSGRINAQQPPDNVQQHKLSLNIRK